MRLIKSVGAANLQSPVIARKFAFVPQENQIRVRSYERDKQENMKKKLTSIYWNHFLASCGSLISSLLKG